MWLALFIYGFSQDIIYKLNSFAHPEFSKPALDDWNATISNISSGTDLFGRSKYQYKTYTNSELSFVYDPRMLSLFQMTLF